MSIKESGEPKAEIVVRPSPIKKTGKYSKDYKVYEVYQKRNAPRFTRTIVDTTLEDIVITVEDLKKGDENETDSDEHVSIGKTRKG